MQIDYNQLISKISNIDQLFQTNRTRYGSNLRKISKERFTFVCRNDEN